jgi:dolichyl-phosphate beta-glucosyltransferase
MEERGEDTGENMMIHGEQQAHLTVVIPAYNEEKRIGPSLEKICEFLERCAFPWEIVVVNDGSRDQTAQLSRELLADCDRQLVIDRKFNRGKGYSVRQGMLAGDGRFLLFSDADLSTPSRSWSGCCRHWKRGRSR